MILLKYIYAPLNLGDFQSFEEKLDTAIAYMEINTIFCHLKDGQIRDLLFIGEYDVVEAVVPPGKRHLSSHYYKMF